MADTAAFEEVFAPLLGPVLCRKYFSSRHVSWALECLCKLQCLLLLVQEKGL